MRFNSIFVHIHSWPPHPMTQFHTKYFSASPRVSYLRYLVHKSSCSFLGVHLLRSEPVSSGASTMEVPGMNSTPHSALLNAVLVILCWVSPETSGVTFLSPLISCGWLWQMGQDTCLLPWCRGDEEDPEQDCVIPRAKLCFRYHSS